MSWSPEKQQGLWLAAQRADDAKLELVCSTLPQEAVDAIEALRDRMGGASRAALARAVTRAVEAVRPAVPIDVDLPARARALLAGEVPRDPGRRWLAASAPPRQGFACAAPLKRWLSRLAVDSRSR